MLQRAVVTGMLLSGLAAGQALADQNAENLDPLFKKLANAERPETAQKLEGKIWHEWMQSGDEAVDRKLEAGILAMRLGRMKDAIGRFSEVIEMAPEFAEGWNKRATAYYLNGELAKSMQDIQETLSLEPRHFGAISGMGLIFLQRGDEGAALEVFEEVLKIHPMSPNANKHVERLRKKLESRKI